MQINFARASHLFLRFFAVTARQRRENAKFHVLWKTETGDKIFFFVNYTVIVLRNSRAGHI